MNIKTKFDIGQQVCVKHDREKIPRMITGVSVRASELLSYNLMAGVTDSWHYEFEIDDNIENIKAGFIK